MPLGSGGGAAGLAPLVQITSEFGTKGVLFFFGRKVCLSG